MERLNTFLIVILIILNAFFLLSMNSHHPESNNRVDQIELAEFQNQMSAQLMVVENEVRSLNRKISDFPNTDLERAQIFEPRTRNINEPDHQAPIVDQEKVDSVNEYVTTIISSGVINHDRASELRDELSKLDPKSFNDALSRINVAINNQMLQLEPGVVL